MGSIWGGSSFKFGIFNRKDKSVKESGGGATYADDYAWYTKYGTTQDEAFLKIRSLVVQVAEAAAKGDLATIEEIDLGQAYKWKMAFHYQPRNALCIINVFMKTPIAYFLGESYKESLKMCDLQQRALSRKKPEEDLLSFALTVISTPLKVAVVFYLMAVCTKLLTTYIWQM